MRSIVRSIAAACCAIAVLHAGPAEAQKRLALAVGIDVYDNLPAHEQLQKAVNDARAMGTALRDLGFETAIEENVAKLAFTRAWQKFLNRLEPGDTAALFFAGHGVEIGGLNFLLPRDVPKVVIGEDKVVAEHSIRFNGLLDDLRDKKVSVALFIVDACRDNPFRDGSGRSVGGTRGLVRVEPAEGSFVMYSAGAGEQALDRLPGPDANPNSVYTRTLLPILATPGLSLQDVALRVREEVVKVARAAGAKQAPAYYDQLVGKLVLKPGAPAQPKPAVAMPPSEVERDWTAVKDASSIAMLEAFIGRHKGTFHASLAQARIDELKRIEESKKVAAAAPPPSPPPAPPAPVTGALKQIKLSQQQVEGFIASHKEMTAAFDKVGKGESDAAVERQLDSIVRKFGFRDHAEYDEVATNIAFVMFGIDPSTRVFTEPLTLARKDLRDAMADKTLPEKERKQLVDEMTELLKIVQPIMHPSNVDLVKRYYDKIEPLLK